MAVSDGRACKKYNYFFQIPKSLSTFTRKIIVNKAIKANTSIINTVSAYMSMAMVDSTVARSFLCSL